MYKSGPGCFTRKGTEYQHKMLGTFASPLQQLCYLLTCFLNYSNVPFCIRFSIYFARMTYNSVSKINTRPLMHYLFFASQSTTTSTSNTISNPTSDLVLLYQYSSQASNVFVSFLTKSKPLHKALLHRYIGYLI